MQLNNSFTYMLNLDGFQLIPNLGAVGQVAQNRFLCRVGFYKKKILNHDTYR